MPPALRRCSLLQGAPQALALDAQLVGLGLAAEDFDELAWRGARLLQRAGCVDAGFANVLQQAEPLPLGEGLWWLHSERLVRQPGLAFVTPQQPLRYRDQPLNGLFCLASLGVAHQALLERLCEVLIEGRGQMLYQAPNSRAVLQVLGGEAPADWPSVCVVLANPHGLHARPAKVLAQLAKGFEGELRVRLQDSVEPAVSLKSLSKLLSLGARRGQTLELIAEPSIANDALPVLLAAIEQGLGEVVEALPETASPSVQSLCRRSRRRRPEASCRVSALRRASPVARLLCR